MNISSENTRLLLGVYVPFIRRRCWPRHQCRPDPQKRIGTSKLGSGPGGPNPLGTAKSGYAISNNADRTESCPSLKSVSLDTRAVPTQPDFEAAFPMHMFDTGCAWGVALCKMSVVLLLAADNRPATIGRLALAVAWSTRRAGQARAAGRRPPPTDHWPPTSSNRLLAADHWPPTTGRLRLVVNAMLDNTQLSLSCFLSARLLPRIMLKVSNRLGTPQKRLHRKKPRLWHEPSFESDCVAPTPERNAKRHQTSIAPWRPTLPGLTAGARFRNFAVSSAA